MVLRILKSKGQFPDAATQQGSALPNVMHKQ